MGSGVGRNAMPVAASFVTNIGSTTIPGPGARFRIAEEREGRDEQGHPILSVSDEWIKP